MKRVKNMIIPCIAVMLAASIFAGCSLRRNGTGDTEPGLGGSAGKMYSVRTVLKELSSVDPEKGIGVYGRYTELTAEGELPEALSGILEDVNARAKENVETRAASFLAENSFPIKAEGSAVTERYVYRDISYIVNVTRADDLLFSVLETEMEAGIEDAAGERMRAAKSCSFRSSVYDAHSGRLLALSDFLKEPESLSGRLQAALSNKYACEGLYTGREAQAPAWTADYLGLRFYCDGEATSEDKKRERGMDADKAVHVSLPYSALDGPFAEAAAKAPESFIAQLEKNTDYALPHDGRVIRIEKAANPSGFENYRIVIREGGNEKSLWLEYADDHSDYYVFRAQGEYYLYRLEDVQDRAYVYSFESSDGGFDRFASQNAQCFDSFLHELRLAVPYDPGCVHMREKSRRFMGAASTLNTSYSPNGHYAFLPEQGRGRIWLHFALKDEALALDSRNTGCRLLCDIGAEALDDAGNGSGNTVIPAGEVLRFLRVYGESELYYHMSLEYSKYQSGTRDYLYDCELSDGRQVRLVTRYESGLFVDGMYMDRIGEPVTLGGARYEAGLGEVPEHYVEIGSKSYRLVRDLSLKSPAGEEIDFAGDVWWKAENYVGTFSSGSGDEKLVISESGDVSFHHQGKLYAGRLPEKRYYLRDAAVRMEAGYEARTFSITVLDELPPHDPSFVRILLRSEGEPATNQPSALPSIEAELVRETNAE